jgi:hypothetical protein
MDLEEVGLVGMDWIALAWDRGQGVFAGECGNESLGSIKCGEFLPS